MKKYVVLGAGLMGKIIAKDILESETDVTVTLIDNNELLLKEVYDFINRDRLTICNLDLNDKDTAISQLKGHDVIISALSHSMSLPSLKLAVQAQVSIIDLVGEAPEKQFALDKEAKVAGIVIIPGCGVAPGISNICVGRGVELLDKTDEAIIYVGGLPKIKEPPLYYQTVYRLESVLGAYLRKVPIIKAGKEIEVEAMSGLEFVDFPEPVGRLEAFYTDGLCSLMVTMKSKISQHLAEKTLRYPGHTDRIRFLKECGMLEKDPVKIDSNEVKPLDVLINQLSPKLKLSDEGDLLIMRIIIKGIKDGKQQTHTFELYDEYDPETGYTAMARTTGFPAVIAAGMIIDETINEKGVKFPEQIFSTELFDTFFSTLERYNIQIDHLT